ncbi:MAG: hypothetical protein QXU98_05155 [Candidatus Parvarchaeota archaeon]
MDLGDDILAKSINIDNIQGKYDDEGDLQLLITSNGIHNKYNIRYNMRGHSRIIKFGSDVDKLNKWLEERGMSLEDFDDEVIE